MTRGFRVKPSILFWALIANFCGSPLSLASNSDACADVLLLDLKLAAQRAKTRTFFNHSQSAEVQTVTELCPSIEWEKIRFIDGEAVVEIPSGAKILEFFPNKLKAYLVLSNTYGARQIEGLAFEQTDPKSLTANISFHSMRVEATDSAQNQSALSVYDMLTAKGYEVGQIQLTPIMSAIAMPENNGFFSLFSPPRVFSVPSSSYASIYGTKLVRAAMPEIDSRKPQRILVMGSGSGFEAITLAKTFGVRVDGVDISEEAVEVAKLNAKINGVAHLNRFWTSDLFSRVNGTYDLILFNAPRPVSKKIYTRYHWSSADITEAFELVRQKSDRGRFDLRAELLDRFLRTLPGFLNTSGKALLMSDQYASEHLPPFLERRDAPGSPNAHWWSSSRDPREGKFRIHEIRRKLPITR